MKLEKGKAKYQLNRGDIIEVEEAFFAVGELSQSTGVSLSGTILHKADWNRVQHLHQINKGQGTPIMYSFINVNLSTTELYFYPTPDKHYKVQIITHKRETL